MSHTFEAETLKRANAVRWMSGSEMHQAGYTVAAVLRLKDDLETGNFNWLLVNRINKQAHRLARYQTVLAGV